MQKITFLQKKIRYCLLQIILTKTPMQLDENLTTIILAILAAIGVTIGITVTIKNKNKTQNTNDVNQKNIKAGGNVSGRDTTINK